MEIKNDLLRQILSKPFGWDISTQKLLDSSSENNGSDNAITEVDEELNQRAGRRLYAETIIRQKNLEDVVQRADEILQSTPITNTSTREENDQGWVEECLDGAGKAYDDELKNYWARLLAGEIRNPGKYSKRITHFMKTISQKDAERIKQICPYVMYDMKGNAVIFRYDDEKLSYEDISFLAELRLLDSSSFVVKQYKFNNGKGQAFLFKKNIGYLLKIEKSEYSLPVYVFTQLGKEVLSIIDDTEADIEYLKNFSTSITKGKTNLVINCGPFLAIDGGAIILKDVKFEIPNQEQNVDDSADNVIK